MDSLNSDDCEAKFDRYTRGHHWKRPEHLKDHRAEEVTEKAIEGMWT